MAKRRIIIFSVILFSFLFLSCVTLEEDVNSTGYFCLWADPIRLTEKEVDALDSDPLFKILLFNEQWSKHCKEVEE